MKNTLNKADITGVTRLWRGYSAPCGEVTKAVARVLSPLWRDHLWRGYLVAKFPVTIYSTMVVTGGHSSNYGAGPALLNFSNRADIIELTPYSKYILKRYNVIIVIMYRAVIPAQEGPTSYNSALLSG